MMNPAIVKNMVDANKVKREQEKTVLAKAKAEADVAWDQYEASLQSVPSPA